MTFSKFEFIYFFAIFVTNFGMDRIITVPRTLCASNKMTGIERRASVWFQMGHIWRQIWHEGNCANMLMSLLRGILPENEIIFRQSYHACVYIKCTYQNDNLKTYSKQINWPIRLTDKVATTWRSDLPLGLSMTSSYYVTWRRSLWRQHGNAAVLNLKLEDREGVCIV